MFADEQSVHKSMPDIHLMCYVPATVKVERAECSLSDADSHFFPNNSPCNFFNVCITKREQIAMNGRISNEN